MRLTKVVYFAATILMASSILFPQWISITFAQGQEEWKSLGPKGGSVRGIAIDKNSGAVYAASYLGGIFKRTNVDGEFALISNGISLSNPYLSANDVAINPTDNNYLIAAAENTVFYSTDGGGLWNPTDLYSSNVVIQAKFLTDSIAVACAYLASEFYKSTNMGQTWETITLPFAAENINKMTLDTVNKIIYINTYREIYKSSDFGSTWIPVPFPETTGIHNMAVGIKSGGLYVIADSLYYTLTPGTNWTTFSGDYPGLSWSVTEDPFTDSVIYLGANEGTYKWTRGTRAWETISNGLFEEQLGSPVNPTVITIKADPDVQGRIYAGTEYAGLYQSNDGGANWQRVGVNATTLHDVKVLDNETHTVVVCGERGIQVSQNGSGWVNTSVFSDIGSYREVLALRTDGQNTLLAGGLSLSSSIITASTNGGENWFTAARQLADGKTTAITFDPLNQDIVFAGSVNGTNTTGLFMSNSGGTTDTSWHPVPGTEEWHVGAIGFSPVEHMLYVVEILEGTVHKSTNGGSTFEDVGNVFLSKVNSITGKDNYVTGIAFIPGSEDIYVSSTAGISRSTNYGVDWSNILPDEAVEQLVIDPANYNHFVAATQTNGIVESTDKGITWNPLTPEIPTKYVTSLFYNENNGARFLYAGTYGNSLYKLNISSTPVELASFTASVENNIATLKWLTATETNNKGFDVEKKENNQWSKIGFVAGNGTSTIGHSYTFIDELNSAKASYRLKQVDFDGSFTYSKEVEAGANVPANYALLQNYPNPFNPTTNISFSLPVDANVTIKLYNTLGEEVATILNSETAAGNHQVIFNAANYVSGVYFYSIEANGKDNTYFKSVKKMMLLK